MRDQISISVWLFPLLVIVANGRCFKSAPEEAADNCSGDGPVDLPGTGCGGEKIDREKRNGQK